MGTACSPRRRAWMFAAAWAGGFCAASLAAAPSVARAQEAYVTKMFREGTPAAQRVFVADPSRGSRHDRGAAVDLTLFDLRTGRPVEMTGGYDEFSDRSYPYYPGGTSLQRRHRDLLRRVMEAEGYTVYEAEWWHFDHGDRRQYPIGTATFEEIERARGGAR
jgi:D-alanyl-D-alanine dipeptidase